MLDHKVTIGGDDVSAEVIKINVQDQIDTDSDPGKITVTLANRLSKAYTAKWPLQKTPIKIIIYNWVYNNESERAAAGGHAEATYLVAYGHVTDIKSNHEEITVTGECDLGHLADALGDDYKTGMLTGNAKIDLKQVLDLHKSLKFSLHYFARKIEYDKEKNYNSETTFQEVLEDIASDVGAIYYFSEDGVLEFRDPAAVRGESIILDPCVINPDDTASLMGFRNRVKVIGDETLAGGQSQDGKETPSSNPIQATAEDAESIAELGVLEAPVDRAVWIGDLAKCQARADLLLNYYKMFKNALTKPKVAGIVPPLHSPISYSVFIPISEDESSYGTVEGAVIARSIEYSIDGLICDLTISPGALNMEEYVGDEEIEDFVLTFDPEE